MSFNIYDKVFDVADVYAYGLTKINDFIFLGGEEDVDFALYGREFTYKDREMLMSSESIDVSPRVNVWIDFRDNRNDNRKIYFPSEVTYVSLPFMDGDIKRAKQSWNIAKRIVDNRMDTDKFLITCHAGVSRSATFVLWLMCEEYGYDKAWKILKSKRKHVEPDKGFKSFVDWLKEEYK